MAVDRLAGKKTLKVGGFLDEFEKDDVKKKVDIVSLFNSYGVKLTRKGKNYTGLCPWHDDKNPSLSVDRDKGLYNCFGCGESGDIFSLVEKMKGFSFREALEHLKSWSGQTQAALSTAKPGKKKEAAAPDPPEVAANPAQQQMPSQTISPSSSALKQESLPELTLRTVAEYYHKQLYGNREARSYLEKRELGAGELLGRFGVGFADGSILSRLSNGQKGKLKDSGILRESGKEHFYGCITIPLHDNSGEIVGLYGRKLKDNGKLKHLYLKGPHRGVFNCKASVVYDEIILTESILDAMSLLSLGIQNVQALYGVKGLTEEHLGLLKADRVKTVILALDSDEAGKKASEALKEQLLEEGFAVKVILPTKTKDWNEVLVAGTSRDEIRSLIQGAEVSAPACRDGQDPGLRVKKEARTYWFKVGSITYRILGVREIFVANLKVNIKAAHQNESFYDTIDLYSSRARENYSSKLSGLFDMEAKRIEKDLIAILEYLEEERDKKLTSQSLRPKERQLSEEEKRLGLEYLKSPNLFDRIVEDMSRLGYVEESINKQIVYLASISRFLPNPLNVYIQSASSGGKSALLSTIEKLIPAEDVWKALTISPQALHYVEEERFLDKVFIMGEDIHDEAIEALIRQMQSEGEISRLVTLKDEKTGEMSARLIRKKVKMSFMVTSTALSLNAENASRCLRLYADESAGQTQKVQYRLGLEHSWEGQVAEEAEAAVIIKRHRAAQKLLEKVKVFNPLGKHISFPTSRPSMRRAYEQFLSMIDSVCFFRQKQKSKARHPHTGEEVVGIECDLDDYQVAYRLFTQGVLKHSFYDIPAGTRKLYEEIRKMAGVLARKEGVGPTEVSFIQKQIREYTRLGGEFIKKHVRLLVDYEYLEASRGKRHGTRYSYRLREDKPIEEMDISMIPTPGELKKRIEEEKNK